ncbi:hypothetical protein BC351_17500 [Paenibacillus ferrarius]|uniref:Dipeptidylpeptidase IV N-terminal domain-containing protein n=1 Tax=Paenibacillus ferrarius TaxID=1469647 RepID=A0A1V4HPT6_9BACL|nr:hypothetical protein [Paenibacillus ferrarius]OPH60293.1 hypothetical protein BC351_17500 [Paenibacillus ferrarius]
MSKRGAELFVLLMIISVMLTGCLQATRSETIIIPDSGNEAATSEKNELFNVKTIYRVMDKSTESGMPLGWMDQDALLSLFGEQTRSASLDRVDYPYESHLKLRNADVQENHITLSPNGQTVASIVQRDDVTYEVNLVSLTDQKQQTSIGRIPNEQIGSVKFGWSNNGRYLIYLTRSGVTGEAQISVYDTTGNTMKGYTFTGWNPKDTITSVHIADDAQSMAVVKTTDKLSYVQFGTWNGNEFASKYEHLVTRDSDVEWIHNDQLAFIGPEGTLYAYDRRNATLSILIEQIGMFRLSSDRKYIAYSQDKDTLYAASLYGNNVLNKTQIFKGVVPSQINWSPDNGKLLLSGLKAYEQDQPRVVIAPGVISNQNMVIEFK